MHPRELGSEPGSDRCKPALRLAIGMSESYSPPDDGYNLLLGFHFGSRPTRHHHPALISLQLPPLGQEQLFELWQYNGEVLYSQSGAVRIADCQDYTVLIIQKETVTDEDFREQTRKAYLELLSAARSTKHRKLVKVWNYFDEINHGDHDFEKYRQFSMGRAEAFLESGMSDQDSPTGTAIGTQKGTGLALIALASNQDFFSVENPRQVSAFHYPRRYGPASPKFSRGGFVSADSHQLFLISGTAAVVGHESNFPYKTSLQANETCKNLRHLCDSISKRLAGEVPFTLDEKSVLRVYLKNPDDYGTVAQELEESMKRNSSNIAYLHGTICRKELMIEIDGVKVT